MTSYGKNTSGKPMNKDSFWRLYEQYRKAKISKSGIARIFGISRQTLYKRLNENLKKYQKFQILKMLRK